MKTEETQAPILLYLWLCTFLTKKVADLSFTLSFVELSQSLLFHWHLIRWKILQNVFSKFCLFVCFCCWFFFQQVKLHQNVRCSHTLDDSKWRKTRTNPKKVTTGKLREGCRLIPWETHLCMICNSLTSIYSTHLGNSVPKLTFSEFKIFLLDNWKKISSVSAVPNKCCKYFNKNTKKQ